MRGSLAAIVLLMLPGFAAGQPAAAGTDANGAVRLFHDVALDYKNFLSVENAEILGLGGAAAGGIHAIDHPVSDWVVETNPSTLTGGYEYGSQLLQIPAAIAWWAIASAAGSSRHADAGRDLLRAQLSAVSWTYAIKLATDRTRPNGDPHGFPSGHASTSFATAMVLQEHYGWKLGLPGFLMATYTAASRIGANEHWMSDVVFGAAVGMASGRTATLHVRTTRVAIAPLAVPGGGGVVVTALR
ncbi:MAG TPA: phosphatase PAP2 family protein [Vicinamibacterales bacterium]|nr:phosphatase PAP2 family protein [Vicinamibacterales bacterium]